jgi:hypothetical protein
MSRLCLYYRQEPERDRWFAGDRFIRPVLRRLLRRTPRPGGVEKVFINLSLGLDRLGERYEVNLPFKKLRADDRVAILGRGLNCLRGYDRPNRIVAGIGLMTHPSEWPRLCEEFPVVRYLQHSEWCDRLYRPYYGDRCRIWPVGINTDEWQPDTTTARSTDFLIYEKVRWDIPKLTQTLLDPIRTELTARGLAFETIRYGSYTPAQFKDALARARALIYLSSHESQGLACQEAMAAGVPVLAWDNGRVLDPERFKWNPAQPEIPATSVPYFDQRCGLRFRDFTEFPPQLTEFQARIQSGGFAPRSYVLENLTLEKCARQFLSIVNEAYAE